MKNKLRLSAIAVVLFMSCAKERLIDEPGNLVPKTVIEDPTLPAIYVNGSKLHSQAFGNPDGPMIVMLHGGPGADYRSLLNCKDLANHGYRVVFYDQRGAGLSERFSKKSFTSRGNGAVDLMYDELSAVIAHYRTHADQKVILIGDSWGGILGAGYAGKYPKAVQGLVIAEAGGLKWEDIVDYVKKSRSFKLWGEMSNDATYMDQFITGKEDQHEILDYKGTMLGAKNEITGEDNTKPGCFWRGGFVANTALFEVADKHKPDFSKGLENFYSPVLFIISEKNKAYQRGWANRVSAPFNSVEIWMAMGTGHSGMFSERPVWTKSTLPKILEYLNKI
jgi:proline iminopeptidase